MSREIEFEIFQFIPLNNEDIYHFKDSLTRRRAIMQFFILNDTSTPLLR